MDEFDEICRRCTPVVYRFLLSLCKDASLADELTAETFYQAYLHIDTFRGICRVESWLCQIAKNALTKELRRQRRAVPFEETHELAAPDDIFELLADKEQAMRIHASLHRLKEVRVLYFELFLYTLHSLLPSKEPLPKAFLLLRCYRLFVTGAGGGSSYNNFFFLLACSCFQ